MAQHLHEFSYTPTALIKDALNLPDVVNDKFNNAVGHLEHRLLMLHDHEGSDEPHHHLADDATVLDPEQVPEPPAPPAPKRRGGIWFGDE